MEILGISIVVGYLGAWFMSRYAYTFGLLDIPNERSSHTLPTPRGGGIGLLVAFVLSAVYLEISIFFWLPSALLSLASFFDDKLDLKPRTRLWFQFTAALAVLMPWILNHHLDSFATYVLITLLCLFIVGTANFYNFMDGINGIAGITGVVGFGLLAFFAHLTANPDNYSAFACSMSAACLGFLPLNLPRARVFMGDVGSILIGFCYATLCVKLSRSFGDFVILSSCLFPFYADALTTLFVRHRDGENLSKAHRRHLYQLLANQMKIAHWKVSLGYGVLQALIGFMMLLLRPAGSLITVLTGIILLLSWWGLMSYVRTRFEVQCL